MKKDADKDERYGFIKTMEENPELLRMGMGLLKSFQDERKADAYQPAEIAKTQYGYLLGQGPGDPSKYRRNTFMQRAAAGYLTGQEKRKRAERDKILLDRIQELTKSGKTPANKPSTVVTPESITSTPYENPSENYMYNVQGTERPYTDFELMLKGVPIKSIAPKAPMSMEVGNEKPSNISDHLDEIKHMYDNETILKKYKEKKEREEAKKRTLRQLKEENSGYMSMMGDE